MHANIFVLCFSNTVPSRLNLFLITGIKVRISGIAIDRIARVSIFLCNTCIMSHKRDNYFYYYYRPDRLSHL